MRDSSDDFFNSFDQSPPRTQSSTRRPPPPPPPGAQRPGPPPMYQQQQQQPPSRPQPPSYVLNNSGSSSSAPPVGPPPPAYNDNHYGAAQQANQTVSTAPPPPPAAASPYAPQYHHHPPQQQQQYHHPAAAPTDWYQQQQQPMSMQPPSAAYGNTFAAPPPGLEGTMDGSSSNHGPNSTVFVPSNNNNPYATEDLADDSMENEPPLLEELGINVEHIFMKTKAVVLPFRRFNTSLAAADPSSFIMDDADLAGPLALALLLGGELLMMGKIQFGSIYGFGLFGCLAMTIVLNLMTPSQRPISFWTVTSVLGYALLPVNVLAALKIVLLGYFMEFFAIIAIVWSTTAATRLLEMGCGMEHQRYLLAYPIALLYSAFVLITIF